MPWQNVLKALTNEVACVSAIRLPGWIQRDPPPPIDVWKQLAIWFSTVVSGVFVVEISPVLHGRSAY